MLGFNTASFWGNYIDIVYYSYFKASMYVKKTLIIFNLILTNKFLLKINQN